MAEILNVTCLVSSDQQVEIDRKLHEVLFKYHRSHIGVVGVGFVEINGIKFGEVAEDTLVHRII
jgi:hypothetical protein